MILAWRDSKGWCNFEFLGDGRVEHEKESDQRRWKISIRNWDLGRFCVQVNLPILIWQVQLLIHWPVSPIQWLLNPIRQVVPLISHICVYPPYHSHVHPPSLFLVNYSTIIKEHKVKLSLSISPCHDFELTPSAAYTESYSIRPRLSVFLSFNQL